MTEVPRPAGEARLDQVRRTYDAIIAGDLDAVMSESADAIEWRNPAEAIEPGTRRGRSSFAVAVDALLVQFDFERLEILDSVESGDAVALKTRVVATGKSSGAPFDTLFGNVFRFDGDRVTAFEWSPDPAAVLAAVSADRWPGGDDAGQGNAAVVRRIFDGLNECDADAVNRLCDDEISIDMSERVFNPDVYRGHEGVRRFCRDVDEAWERYHWDVEETRPVGNLIVVMLHCQGQSREGAPGVDWRVAWLWELEDGKAVSVRFYRDRSKALEAAGIRVVP